LLRDDKRFLYIKISTEDEIREFLSPVRSTNPAGILGPFTSSTAVRETVKAIRKIWPFCTGRSVKTKPCFYYHVGRCLGVCGGIINSKDYKDKVINPIILFLEGKKSKIITNFQLQISNFQKQLKDKKISSEGKNEIEEKLNLLEYQLKNMLKVLEHTEIIGISEKYAADVIELAKILGLPKIPVRIEGYDISNIFGQEAVGSMVVFFRRRTGQE